MATTPTLVIPVTFEWDDDHLDALAKALAPRLDKIAAHNARLNGPTR